MKMKRLHLLLLFLMVQLASFAGPRSFQQAKEIAALQAAKLGIVMDGISPAKVKYKSIKSATGEVPAYYVFSNGDGKGFTVVSGDDRLPEIVGYSDKGTYDEEHLPTNYVGFMKAYEEMVLQIEQNDSHVSKTVAEAKALRGSGYQQPAVAPLLDGIHWNQMAPYNYMCPLYNGTDRSVTGCVATAMAQVMMYYKYPAKLQADIPAYVTSSYAISVPQINKGEAYDWDNMLESYTAENYTDAQASAVAKLMYHCGAVCKMDYGPSSGANVTPARLATYFGYDADLMQDLTRSSFSLAEWTQIMDNELTAKRPILYAGQSSGGGHEFVCDGSDGNGLYHINWGWGGYQDGYFDVSILNPDKGGAGSGNAPDGYNRYCSMIIGIAPDNGMVDEPLVKQNPIVMIGSGRSTMEITQATRSNVKGAFEIKTNSYIANQATAAFAGYFAYGVKNVDGSYLPISESLSIGLGGALSDGRVYVAYPELSFRYAFPVGRTTLYGLYSTDRREWKKCDYVYLTPFVVEATETDLTMAETNLSANIIVEDELLSEQENTLQLTVSNQADFEYLGLLSIYTNTTNAKPEKPTTQVYCTISSMGSLTRPVTISPSVGDLYVWVTDENGVGLMDAKRFTVTQSTEPKLVLVGKETNATPGEYETENAYRYSYKVKLPKTNDDKAVFTYRVRNDGGSYVATFLLRVESYGEEGAYLNQLEKHRINSGETVSLRMEARPEDYGNNHSFYSSISLYNASTSLDVSTFPTTKLYLVDGGWFIMDEVEQFVYVAGVSSGISSIATSGTSIRGGKGEILLSSDKAQSFRVYNLNGQSVACVVLKAGEQMAVPVAAGLYIVNDKKIIVR